MFEMILSIKNGLSPEANSNPYILILAHANKKQGIKSLFPFQLLLKCKLLLS